MEKCIFCKIGSGKIPAHKVYEDKDFLAFLDIHPHALGHTVIIPKIHAQNIFDLDETKTKKFIIAVKRTMQLLQEKLNPEGFNVGWNQNQVAGQAILHYHIHIFPRYSGDGGGSMHSIIKNPGDKSVEEVAKLFK